MRKAFPAVQFFFLILISVSSCKKNADGNGGSSQDFYLRFKANGIQNEYKAHAEGNFNRVSGEVVVNIPAFVPRKMVGKVSGMTHFKIVAAAAAINFDTEAYEYAMQGTPELPYNGDPTQATILTLALPANSTGNVVVVLGIEYIQQVNTKSYSLKSGNQNAATILLVDKPV